VQQFSSLSAVAVLFFLYLLKGTVRIKTKVSIYQNKIKKKSKQKRNKITTKQKQNKKNR